MNSSVPLLRCFFLPVLPFFFVFGKNILVRGAFSGNFHLIFRSATRNAHLEVCSNQQKRCLFHRFFYVGEAFIRYVYYHIFNCLKHYVKIQKRIVFILNVSNLIPNYKRCVFFTRKKLFHFVKLKRRKFFKRIRYNSGCSSATNAVRY